MNRHRWFWLKNRDATIIEWFRTDFDGMHDTVERGMDLGSGFDEYVDCEMDCPAIRCGMEPFRNSGAV